MSTEDEGGGMALHEKTTVLFLQAQTSLRRDSWQTVSRQKRNFRNS